jgi:hypothetical protein
LKIIERKNFHHYDLTSASTPIRHREDERASWAGVGQCGLLVEGMEEKRVAGPERKKKKGWAGKGD